MYRDPDDGFAAQIASTVTTNSIAGATTVRVVEDGNYAIWSYTACPWSVRITGAVTMDYVPGAELRNRWLAWDDAIAAALPSFSDLDDDLMLAGDAIAMGHASKEAAAWIDVSARRVRSEHVEAVQRWRDAATEVDRVSEVLFIAASTGTTSDLRDAIAQVASVNALRRAVTDLFGAIR